MPRTATRPKGGFFCAISPLKNLQETERMTLGPRRVLVGAFVDPDVKQGLRSRAAKADRSLSAEIRIALRRQLDAPADAGTFDTDSDSPLELRAKLEAIISEARRGDPEECIVPIAEGILEDIYGEAPAS